MLVLCCACTMANKLNAQPLDFKNTIYYTAAGNVLTSSGQSLTGFDYSTAPSTHPIFNVGIFFPVVDFQGNNIWVKVTHIAADPNGTSVGVNVAATCSDPFRAGFGGWAGFLYQFEIYKDATVTGTPSNMLDGFFPSNISVESIETLSAGEWLSFELLNAESNNWALNSINFTGNNPGSNPGFSAVSIPWPGSQPPPGFSTTFPAGSKNIYVVDYGGSSYAEFKMSAENVSRFNYGYEYTGLCGGYQGMNLSFGNRVIPRVGIAVSQGLNPGCTGSLLEFKATPVNAGTGSTYQWKRNGAAVAGANTDTYSSNNFTAGEVVTCVMTTSLAISATSNSITILTPVPASTWYLDADGDLYYTGSPVMSCSSPGAGYTTNVIPGGDCDDNNKDVHPGATEICGNGIDDNCDGQIDEGCTVYTFYKDADGDTYGDPASPITNFTGIVPVGYVTNNKDCNDNNKNVNPAATEICGNGIDDNCNGQIDEGCSCSITVSICDANITEGNYGTKLLCFAVTLSKPATATSTVKYKTSNGTALSSSDYKAADATISFAAGQSIKYLCVVINGDYKVEQNETFYVTLYSPVNLVLSNKKTATGIIINDDKCGYREAGITSKSGEEASILNVPTLMRRGQQLKIPNLPANNKVMLYNANGRLLLNAANYSNNANLSNMAAGMYYYNIIITDKEGKQEMFKGKIIVMD